MVYSFDIFDTLIARNTMSPKDIFFNMEKSGMIKVQDFRNKRVRAEIVARKNSKYEEITLDEIYYELGRENDLSDEELNLIKKCELETEYEALIPICVNIELLNNLVSKGEKVVLISDMYLSSNDIFKLLKKCDIPLEKIEIFVSSEYRATKRSGKLFKVVLEKLNIKPNAIMHKGDNLKSDYLVPKALGIKVKLFRQSYLNKYEKIITNRNPELANCMRISRISNQKPNSNYVWETATDVLAPITIGYISWIKKYVEDNNMDRLLFVSRDGQLMYKVWDILFREMNQIKYSYIYGSRKVWYFPSIIDREKYNNAISEHGWIKTENISYNDFLGQFNFSQEEISELMLSNKYRVDISLSELVNDESFIRCVLEKAKKDRQIVCDYFQQLGIKDGEKIALVDLGWTGKSLESARDIILDMFPNCSVEGLVLGKRNSNKKMDWFHEWLIHDNRNCLRSEVYLLETIFAASHETVIAYKYDNNKVVPILKCGDYSQQTTMGLIKEQQNSACRLAEIYKPYIDLISIESEDYYEVFREFVFNPKIVNIIAYMDYPFSRDAGDKNYILLAKKLKFIELLSQLQVLSIVFNKFSNKRFSQLVYWLEASAKLSGTLSTVLVKIDNILVKTIYSFRLRRNK